MSLSPLPPDSSVPGAAVRAGLPVSVSGEALSGECWPHSFRAVLSLMNNLPLFLQKKKTPCDQEPHMAPSPVLGLQQRKPLWRGPVHSDLCFTLRHPPTPVGSVTGCRSPLWGDMAHGCAACPLVRHLLHRQMCSPVCTVKPC